MRRAHLITCLSKEDYQQFIENGFAGLYPQKVKEDKVQSSKSRLSRLRTNLDIIADLKRVKKDDYVFLHIKNKGGIYGPFIAKTEFKESPNVAEPFKSNNLTKNFWKNKFDENEIKEEYPWRISIESVEGVTKDAKIDAMELFKLKSAKASIHSIPERFFYQDSPKIVKPLLTHESEQILDLLEKAGMEANSLKVKPQELEGFKEIRLNLIPHGNEVYTEKIIESWLLENSIYKDSNYTENKNIREIFGEFEHFANTIFTYYTNFLDVLFYSETQEKVAEFCQCCGKFNSKNKTNISVVEVKKSIVSEETINQVKEYGEWALKVLGDNKMENLRLFIIGKDFEENMLEKSGEINCIKYHLIDEHPYFHLEKIN